MSHQPGPRLKVLLQTLAGLLADVADLTTAQTECIKEASEDPKNLPVLVAVGYEASQLQHHLEAITQTVDKVEFTKLISHALFFTVYVDALVDGCALPHSMLAMTAQDMAKSDEWSDTAAAVLAKAQSLKAIEAGAPIVENLESNHVSVEPTSDMFGVTTVGRLGLKGKQSGKAS